MTLEEAEEAVEAWRLWELLPEPKRLHCEYRTAHVLVGKPGRMGLGAPDEMLEARIWADASTAIEAIREAATRCKELGWLEVAE